MRFALIEGLREEERLSINSYQFSFIGSMNSQTAAPGAVSEYEQLCKYVTTMDQMLTVDNRPRAFVFQNPGGLAGVWGEENTRDAIFNALKHRDTVANSGPRIA